MAWRRRRRCQLRRVDAGAGRAANYRLLKNLFGWLFSVMLSSSRRTGVFVLPFPSENGRSQTCQKKVRDSSSIQIYTDLTNTDRTFIIEAVVFLRSWTDKKLRPFVCILNAISICNFVITLTKHIILLFRRNLCTYTFNLFAIHLNYS